MITVVEQNQKLRILYVEDKEEYRELAILFTINSATVICANDGEHGLQTLEQMLSENKPPDLILLDNTMPVRDGLGFMEQYPKNISVPVYVCTDCEGTSLEILTATYSHFPQVKGIVPKLDDKERTLEFFNQVRVELELNNSGY